MAALIRGRTRATAVAFALVGALVLGVFLSTRAPAAPTLPGISPRNLVTNALRALSAEPSVSGDARVHVDLGIPQLPTGEGAPSTGPLALLSDLSGDHQLRVWSSRAGFRVAEILPAAERAVFASRTELWLWDSSTLTATRVVGRPAAPRGREPSPSPSPSQLDPGALAARFLHAITPSTTVSVGDPTTVAGRAVYPLMLRPDDAGTLVGKVELDVDAQTWIPLRDAVFPRGSDAAALSAGYTDVSFDPIDPSTYDFTPPPGVTVKTVTLGGHRAGNATNGTSESDDVRTVGRDWTEVVAVRLPSPSSSPGRQRGADAMLSQIEGLLPYAGPLASADIVTRPSGRWLVAGMVPPAGLATAEAQLP